MMAVAETNQDVAVQQLRDAIALDSGNKLAYYHLGMIYAGRGLHNAAVTEYDNILTAIDGRDAGIWFLRARQHHLAANNERALEDYTETLKLDPLCEKAYLYIAQILIALSRDAARALKSAETALMIRRSDCMVPAAEFETTLVAARDFASAVSLLPAVGAPVLPSLREVRLAGLTERGPHVVAVLERHGIGCSSCAGYAEETLDAAAREAGAELHLLERDLTIAMQEETNQ
jgi:tetratricopeptide (TPR) repeat protein